MIKCSYRTPDGFTDLIMTSDGDSLTGLNFIGSKDATHQQLACEEHELPIFRKTRRWLDVYFSGRQPDFTPPYTLCDLTPFRQDVVDEMLKIPFGKTASYGSIANAIAARRGQGKMSAQAVGGAVGWNPICLIIPCHRVIGANGNMTGYGGGLNNKIALLALEKRCQRSRHFVRI